MSSSFEASFNDTQDSIEKAGRVIITIVVVSFIVFGIAFVVNLIIHVLRFIKAWKDGVLFSAPYGLLWNEREYPMVPMGVKQSCQRLVDDRIESSSSSSTSTRDSQLERGGNVDQFLINFKKEKPVRFSAEQLKSFTQGYSHRVGRGGFSDVYKGEFPTGEEIVVKLMNYDSGTQKYAAPEVRESGRMSHKSDVYSFGMTLFEIIGQRNNWDGQLRGTDQEHLPRWAYKMSEQNRMPELIYALNIPSIYQRVAIKAVYVALLCIQRMPEDRPMMSSVVKMLDGDVEIPAPANPFLDEIRKWAPNLSTVYSEDQSSVPSSSLT
ncbi:hypothetical protein Droror1_Dr00012792 [Drosera rotundifolia]